MSDEEFYYPEYAPSSYHISLREKYNSVILKINSLVFHYNNEMNKNRKRLKFEFMKFETLHYEPSIHKYEKIIKTYNKMVYYFNSTN